VYDGGGIEPDIAVAHEDVHPVTQTLFSMGYIFDYATRYAFNSKTEPDPKNFSLSSEEYQQFVNWMKDKDYRYNSRLDKQLTALSNEAKRERYYSELKSQIDQISTRISENKKNELTLYKDQIKMLLEEDIISRFHLERGSIQVGLKNDEDIKKSTEVLSNATQYKKLLNSI
jgi:carboxyl-terminal processing protease